jgi:hypothetical protein
MYNKLSFSPESPESPESPQQFKPSKNVIEEENNIDYDNIEWEEDLPPLNKYQPQYQPVYQPPQQLSILPDLHIIPKPMDRDELIQLLQKYQTKSIS